MLVNTGEQIMEMLLIGGGIFALGILLLVIIFLVRKRKKGDDE